MMMKTDLIRPFSVFQFTIMSSGFVLFLTFKSKKRVNYLFFQGKKRIFATSVHKYDI